MLRASYLLRDSNRCYLDSVTTYYLLLTTYYLLLLTTYYLLRPRLDLVTLLGGHQVHFVEQQPVRKCHLQP